MTTPREPSPAPHGTTPIALPDRIMHALNADPTLRLQIARQLDPTVAAETRRLITERDEALAAARISQDATRTARRESQRWLALLTRTRHDWYWLGLAVGLILGVVLGMLVGRLGD